MTGEEAFDVLTQLMPGPASVAGDVEKTKALAEGIVSAGTFDNKDAHGNPLPEGSLEDPFHLYDWNRWTSIPMRWTVPAASRDITLPDVKHTLDHDCQADNTWNSALKGVKYVTGFLGALIAFGNIARTQSHVQKEYVRRQAAGLLTGSEADRNVEALIDCLNNGGWTAQGYAEVRRATQSTDWEDFFVKDDIARRHLRMSNWGELLGNFGWGVEKALFPVALYAVMSGSYYLATGAGIMGLWFSNLAWVSKIIGSNHILSHERFKFMEAYRAGKDYHINTPNTQAAFFTYGNSIRMMKHLFVTVTTVLLYLNLRQPDVYEALHGYLPDVVMTPDYYSDTRNRLGVASQDSPLNIAKAVFRNSNNAYVMPNWLIGCMALYSSLASAPIMLINAAKIKKDSRTRKRLKEKVQDGGMTPEIAAELKGLRREMLMNTLGFASGICLTGGAIMVSYTATDPHALGLAALAGSLGVAQYMLKRAEPLKMLVSSLPGLVWKAGKTEIKPRHLLLPVSLARKLGASTWQTGKNVFHALRSSAVAKGEEKAAARAARQAEGPLYERAYQSVRELPAKMTRESKEWGLFFRVFWAQMWR
ncbi:MAG: hypothetical protein WC690_01720 [bacterium]